MNSTIWWNLLLVWYLMAGAAFEFWYGDGLGRTKDNTGKEEE